MINIILLHVCTITVHTIDEADVIRRKRQSIDRRQRLRSNGLFDNIPIIGESGLARFLLWKQRVTNAVNESEKDRDQFWTEVCSKVAAFVIIIMCTYIYYLHACTYFV